MLRTTRLLLIGLFTLMQLIAPLVHAHAGGGEVADFLHVPGLEFLSHKAKEGVRSTDAHAPLDVIVGLAPGLKHAVDQLLDAPDPDDGPLPPVFTFEEVLRLPLCSLPAADSTPITLNSTASVVNAPRGPPSP